MFDILNVTEKENNTIFIMKVPDSGHEERMLAYSESWTLDGQAGMSKEGNSPDYEYRRRLREHKVRSNERFQVTLL